MIRLGINEFIRNIKRNIMVILQLTAILILSVLMVSVYDAQTRMSRAVMKYIDDTGIYYTYKFGATQLSDEELSGKLTGVESIIHANETGAGVHKGERLIASFSLLSYDEEKVNYRPPLKTGRWYDSVKEEEGVINVVVAENSMGYSTGDVIEVEGHRKDSGKLSLKITGTVYDKTMLFGGNGWSSDNNNSYLNLFTTQYELKQGDYLRGAPDIYAVMSEENVQKYGFYTNALKGIIDLKDDITEKEMDENKEILKENCMVTDTASMEQNSEKILFNKLGGISVVFVVLLLITITSIICSGAVTFLYERRNYGIYFITGNNWKNTILLSLMNWLLVCLSAVLLSGVAFGAAIITGLAEKYTLSFTWVNAAIYLAIIAATLVTALAIPLHMLRKSQPVQILKNNLGE